MRRKSLLIGLALLAATGCQTPNQTNGAVAGGVMGGILGTGIGALCRAPGAGMLIGAGAGAMAGSAVGAAQDKKEIKAAQQYAADHPALSLTEIVAMTSNRIPDDQIVRQIVATNSYYNLTTADLQYLNDQHVSPVVIATMQQRTVPGPVVVRPAPMYVVPAYPPPPPPVAVGVGVTVPIR
jgi:hypothetical protein